MVDIRDVAVQGTVTLTVMDAPPLVPDLPTGAPWLQTIEGRALDLVNPDPATINFRTIAVTLARVPRFAGQTTKGVLSVAQHCCEGARAIMRDTGRQDAAAAFLLHDAHEAFIGDIPTPVLKAIQAHAVHTTGDLHNADVVKAAVTSLKAVLDTAVYQAAGLSWPLAPEVQEIVKEYDVRMLCTERAQRLVAPPRPWTTVAPHVEGCDLDTWSEFTAASLYWNACHALLPIFVDSSRKYK
jgi:hypothetical protein